MIRFLSFISLILNIIAFVLLLLVSLSGLVITGIYILILPYITISATGLDIPRFLRMGVLGFCQTVDQIYADYLEIPGTTACYGPHRGYTIPLDVVTSNGLPLVVSTMLDPQLVSVMILHPISAALALVCSVLSFTNRSRPIMGIALSYTICNGILATVAFGIDLAVVDIAKSRINQYLDSFEVPYPAPSSPYSGSGPWLTLAAAICIWAAVVVQVIKMWKYGGNRKSTEVAGLSSFHSDYK
ncbi:hypothetical protein BYT27DRAFT_7226590 [Phlegmacium glaucopus]|nr:hypothetical protein BYT27DRAFT_7226590 [Phlegmacium glaucopus]